MNQGPILTDGGAISEDGAAPSEYPGQGGVEYRRVISGIIHVPKSGGRWVDAPPDYGPKKTLYNRYVCWAAKGVWVNLFQALAISGGPPAQVLIHSSAVKARSAAGGKGGEKSGRRPLARSASIFVPFAQEIYFRKLRVDWIRSTKHYATALGSGLIVG